MPALNCCVGGFCGIDGDGFSSSQFHTCYYKGVIGVIGKWVLSIILPEFPRSCDSDCGQMLCHCGTGGGMGETFKSGSDPK